MQTRQNRAMRALPLLMLAGLFLITAVTQIAFTGIYYNKTLDLTDQARSLRVMQSYVTNQARQAVAVQITEFDGVQALSCIEDGYEYETLLYLYNGSLYELYTGIDAGLTREDGTALLPLSRFEPVEAGSGLLEIHMVDEYGQSVSVCVRKGTAA